MTDLELGLKRIAAMKRKRPLCQDTTRHSNRWRHYQRLYPDSPPEFIDGYVSFLEGHSIPNNGKADWVRGWARAARQVLLDPEGEKRRFNKIGDGGLAPKLDPARIDHCKVRFYGWPIARVQELLGEAINYQGDCQPDNLDYIIAACHKRLEEAEGYRAIFGTEIDANIPLKPYQWQRRFHFAELDFREEYSASEASKPEKKWPAWNQLDFGFVEKYQAVVCRD